MSPPGTRGGPPPQGPARNEISATAKRPDPPQRSGAPRQVTVTTTPSPTSQDARVPVARAVGTPPSAGRAVWAWIVARCPYGHIEPDPSPTEEELRAEVHRLVEEVVTAARSEHGHIPGVQHPDWWSAPRSARLAAILVLGEAYLITDPHQIAAEQLRGVSRAISGGLDWSRAAHCLVYERPGVLAARRAVAATPLRCGQPGCLAVVTVEHPLPPDLRDVRCPLHASHAGAAV